jgi:DNA-binding MarR family transcriptional regulator
MGLVERTRSEQDRRIVTCRLTPRGRKVLTERRAHIEGRWDDRLSGFTVEELETAAAVLEQLRGLFDDLLAEDRR